MNILDEIPFEPDTQALLEGAHVEPGSEDAEEFTRLLERARIMARPKALYRECYIERRGNDTVTIEGVTFTSRALRVNLGKAERVFPYVATCGKELDRIDLPAGDFLKQFWMDAIKAAALGVSILRGSVQHGMELEAEPGAAPDGQ